MRLTIILITITLFATSCAFHSGVMTGSAALTNSNFKYVGLAKGTATTTHVFGIGGLKKQALVFEAKKNLLKNYPLREGQALANVAVDMKKTFVFPVIKTRVTLTADVVDFNAHGNYTNFDSMIVDNYVNGIMDRYGLGLFDSVYFVGHGSIIKGEIRIFVKKSAKIKYTASNGSSFTELVTLDKVLLRKPSGNEVDRFGFYIHEKVRFLDDDGRMEEAAIFGINKKYIGVKYAFKSNGHFLWKILPITRIQKLR